MHDPHVYSEPFDAEPRASHALLHTVRAIRGYMPVILVSMLAVGIGYTIFAIASYLMAPRQEVTAVPFRLEFEGAERGLYPNGTKFSAPEIVSTPILTKAYNASNLSRYLSPAEFAESIVVLESNPAYEQLAVEYQAKLSDPRLQPVDRERIQREYDQKRQSLAKNYYALSFLGKDKAKTPPPTVTRKALQDILKEWARYAVVEQRVLQHGVALVSPDVVQVPVESSDPLTTIHVLRSRINRVKEGMNSLSVLPGAELTRTKDGLSLHDMQIRLEEIVRFRLEPLVGVICSDGMIRDREATLRFLENQLNYDERVLNAQRATIEGIRSSMMAYTSSEGGPAMPPPSTSTAPGTSPTTQQAAAQGTASTVVLSDSFLDRMVQLSLGQTDVQFRQKYANDLRLQTLAMVPLEQSVAYDRQVLGQVRNARVGGADPTPVVRQLEVVSRDLRTLVTQLNDLHVRISQSIHPSTQLYAAGPPITRIERTANAKRLALLGLLTMLLALPIVVGLCLVHNHLRKEEHEEGGGTIPATAAPAE